ncbi:MAG TPA: DUF2309 domain-containing protein [Candidatus Binatia bacterium]
MGQLAATQYSETERMELRALVLLASEVIADYWPMRTFVHHNQLHGLEYLHFEEAVSRARRLLDAKGYLSVEVFRDYFRSGRILPDQLDGVLKARAENRHVQLAAHDVTLGAVLRACMLQDLSPPPADTFGTLLERHPNRTAIETLASHLLPAMKLPQSGPGAAEQPYLGRTLMLASWCDRTLGTEIGEQINRELVKWCEAFLDEGHATWPMPRREKGFYGAWRFLTQQEWSSGAITNSREKLARLPAQPEDALLESLGILGIPAEARQDYLSLHLVALSGWAGFIKWRADQSEYEWQLAYPIDLAQYLAVRLWYERELVQKACRESLGIAGNIDAISTEMQRRENSSAKAPGHAQADRPAALVAAWRLYALAQALGHDPGILTQSEPGNLLTLLEWINGFPESDHGPIWLQAFEGGYQEELIGKLPVDFGQVSEVGSGQGPARRAGAQSELQDEIKVRHQAQAVFCIDVRSEPIRRHLEAIGDYETFGFAGFFAVFIRYQSLGSDHETDQFPVIMKSKNLVREIPRTYQGQYLFRRRHREKLLDTGHTLLYDLKENVVTPYVMVESLGWFYSLPLIGKTLSPTWYRNVVSWLRRKLVPPVATTLTVDKLSREEVEEMLAAEQRAITRRALQENFGERHLNLSLERLEFLRRRALYGESAGEPSPQARSTALSREEEAAFVEDLRRNYGINPGASFARMERITRTGFTVSEQVFTVETALRMMGLTRNFARLVLFCGHGSTSENNPFEAALDCGACGGNPGKANARVLAIMANKPPVREQLAKNGIAIPQDTYFIAGQHNTTTDDIDLFDLEDLPPTHRKDLLQLVRDLELAGTLNSQERCARFPEIKVRLSAAKARRAVHRRSADWSQVRPEWGLSGNAAFIIGRRALTRGINLEGRAFLHSYDYREDFDGRLLEVVMTGPQIVGQWINMEHYFSAVDPEHYGSGSKIYHNVVGRFGVMSGPQSDLRTGLAWQTVMNGVRPYHEPMRLVTLVEAPRERIDKIILNQRHLKRLYDNQWVYLIAIEPEEQLVYRYVPREGWQPVKPNCSSLAQRFA